MYDMREIDCQDITRVVSRLCREACYHLPEDRLTALVRALEHETSPAGQEVMRQLIENAGIAATGEAPLCQDCGYGVVYLELGQDAHVMGGDLYSAVHEGVRQGYREGFLRKSMVFPPIFERKNTGDNTPAVIHLDIVPGDHLRIVVLPKGGGSENASALATLTPAAGAEGVADFVVGVVDKAGPNACPPVIVGVGVGGTAEKAMALAKHALLRPLGEPSPDAQAADLESKLLERINGLGVGPMGYGGRVTALAVHVEMFPTHIASLPVGVNLLCHSARVKEAVL